MDRRRIRRNCANAPRAENIVSADSTPVNSHNQVPDSAFTVVETRMLRLTEVIRRTGLGKTKLYELQKEGRFPMRVHVTGTAVRWIDSEVEDWLVQQAQARSSTWSRG
jgi:prophage regulatory protein